MTRLVLTTRAQDTFEAAFAHQIESFRAVRPDVEIEVVTRPIHDHYESMVEQGGAADTDLFLCCTDWLPAAISNNLIQPLNRIFEDEPLEDWPHGWHAAMRKLVVHEDTWFGLPWHDGPQVFMARSDLFESREEQDMFRQQHGCDLTIPKTWDEFLRVAKFFTRPEQDLWGCVLAGYTDGHNNVYDFLIHLWSRGGTLLDDDFAPQFQDAVGVESLEFLSGLFHEHAVVAPQCLNLGSVESGDYYAQGHAAMMWNWCGFASVCELEATSKIVGKNRCHLMPAGAGPMGQSVSLNIYWALTVGRNCQNIEVVESFLRHVARPDCDKVTSMVGANGTRLSTWRDADVRAKYPHYELIEAVHGGTLTLPAIPEYTEINESISRAVHRVVHERAPAGPSIARAADEVCEILRKSGRCR